MILNVVWTNLKQASPQVYLQKHPRLRLCRGLLNPLSVPFAHAFQCLTLASQKGAIIPANRHFLKAQIAQIAEKIGVDRSENVLCAKGSE